MARPISLVNSVLTDGMGITVKQHAHLAADQENVMGLTGPVNAQMGTVGTSVITARRADTVNIVRRLVRKDVKPAHARLMGSVTVSNGSLVQNATCALRVDMGKSAVANALNGVRHQHVIDPTVLVCVRMVLAATSAIIAKLAVMVRNVRNFVRKDAEVQVVEELMVGVSVNLVLKIRDVTNAFQEGMGRTVEMNALRDACTAHVQCQMVLALVGKDLRVINVKHV